MVQARRRRPKGLFGIQRVIGGPDDTSSHRRLAMHVQWWPAALVPWNPEAARSRLSPEPRTVTRRDEASPSVGDRDERIEIG